jgi:outer membrane usher protein
VTIYENEQPVTRTDAHGAAVVPDLRPFESNSLALDPTTLPLSLDVPQTRFEVIPYRRGGAYIDVRVQLAASVRLRLPGGEFVPAGAAVHVGSASAPVGIGGMAYVEGRAGDNLLRVEWDGGVCHAHLDLPAPPARDAVDDSVELRCITDR